MQIYLLLQQSLFRIYLHEFIFARHAWSLSVLMEIVDSFTNVTTEAVSSFLMLIQPLKYFQFLQSKTM